MSDEGQESGYCPALRKQIMLASHMTALKQELSLTIPGAEERVGNGGGVRTSNRLLLVINAT